MQEPLMLESIKQILMRRDNMTEDEAEELISSAKEELTELISRNQLDQAFDICEIYFGLEEDYLDQLY